MPLVFSGYYGDGDHFCVLLGGSTIELSSGLKARCDKMFLLLHGKVKFFVDYYLYLMNVF